MRIIVAVADCILHQPQMNQNFGNAMLNQRHKLSADEEVRVTQWLQGDFRFFFYF